MLKNNKGFTLWELIVSIICVIIALMVISGFIALISIGIHSCNNIQKHGLKAMTHQIWEGKDTTQQKK
jgi:hypothetical protein